MICVLKLNKKIKNLKPKIWSFEVKPEKTQF